MSKRITIVLDDDLVKRLREKQAKLIKESVKSVSFSRVVNDKMQMFGLHDKVLIVKKDDVASWAYSKAVISEKRVIAEADLSGIDTIEVNRIADEFLAKVDTARYTQVELMPFVKFVQDGGMDEKVDSAEAVAFVNAMVESFPDLEQYKHSEVTDDMTEQTDSSAASDQSY